jgi:hypothetical protein
MQLWSPVSGSDRHSVVHRKVNDGSAARPRGKRGWRGRRSRWARAHDRSCGRSRTTTSKPERATPRETGALHRPDSRGDPKPPERNDVGPRVAAAKSRDRGHSPSASIRKKRRDVHDVARRSARNRTNPFKAGASRFRIVRGRVRHPAHGPIVVRRSVDASASRASSREAPLRCHRSMKDVPDRRALLALHGAGGGGGLDRSSDDSSRSKDAVGRIERRVTERQTGRPHGGTTGRQRPRGLTGGEHVRRSVSQPIVLTRKRMGCREARHASVRSTCDWHGGRSAVVARRSSTRIAVRSKSIHEE